MLFDLYKDLCESVPSSGQAILGLTVRPDDRIWLSIDSSGHPALLLAADSDDVRADIILRAVNVEFSRSCTIQRPDNRIHEGCYSIVRLKESDTDIIRLFLRIVEERFCTGRAPETNAALAESIQEIASLFSHLGLDTRDIVGLWGELFAISRSVNLDSAVRAWSSKKLAKYDFVADSFVLDVKATLSNVPKHRFSLEQLRPAGDYKVFILSLCLVEVQAGSTVGEFMDSIVERVVDSALRAAFLRSCLVKGGRDIYRSDLRLQSYPEAESFKVFEADSIPVPSIDTRDPISNLRFNVDLSFLEPLQAEKLSMIINFGE